MLPNLPPTCETATMRRAPGSRGKASRFTAKPLILPGICSFMAALLVARPARASSVDVRCGRLTLQRRGELQARARLLLLGAGMDTARVTVDCDASASWLVWVDGSRTTLDETSGLVEGALDAIENRLERTRKAAPVAPVAAPPMAPVVVAHPQRAQEPSVPATSSAGGEVAPSDEV